MTLRRLASLLPDEDPTSLLGSVLGDLHSMEPELLALKVRSVSHGGPLVDDWIYNSDN